MAATKVNKNRRRKKGQSMLELLLLMGLLSAVVVLVRNLVLGGPGSVGYEVMGYFVGQMDSAVGVGSSKAVLGGKPSWNHYYIDSDVRDKAQASVQ